MSKLSEALTFFLPSPDDRGPNDFYPSQQKENGEWPYNSARRPIMPTMDAMSNAPLAGECIVREASESNLAGVVEVPRNTYPVKVEPPRAKRKKYPFVGFIDFQGLEIDIENKKGDVRSGVDPDGTPWSTTMFNHYGEIRGTEGVDGDKLDAYVGPNHDASLVVVVHQHDPATGKFDEDKVMLGFDSEEEAIGAYKKQYNHPGFYVEDDYIGMPIGQFWRWVHDKKKQGKKIKEAMMRNRHTRRLQREGVYPHTELNLPLGSGAGLTKSQGWSGSLYTPWTKDREHIEAEAFEDFEEKWGPIAAEPITAGTLDALKGGRRDNMRRQPVMGGRLQMEDSEHVRKQDVAHRPYREPDTSRKAFMKYEVPRVQYKYDEGDESECVVQHVRDKNEATRLAATISRRYPNSLVIFEPTYGNYLLWRNKLDGGYWDTNLDASTSKRQSVVESRIVAEAWYNLIKNYKAKKTSIALKLDVKDILLKEFRIDLSKLVPEYSDSNEEWHRLFRLKPKQTNLQDFIMMLIGLTTEKGVDFKLFNTPNELCTKLFDNRDMRGLMLQVLTALWRSPQIKPIIKDIAEGRESDWFPPTYTKQEVAAVEKAVAKQDPEIKGEEDEVAKLAADIRAVAKQLRQNPAHVAELYADEDEEVTRLVDAIRASAVKKPQAAAASKAPIDPQNLVGALGSLANGTLRNSREAARVRDLLSSLDDKQRQTLQKIFDDAAKK